MTDIVLVGATFATAEAGSIALIRLRRHQARHAGKLRLAPLGAPGRIIDEVVVAGPVFADALPAVRAIVEELGGRIVAIVESEPQLDRS
jgi:hypothetical protein